MIGFLNFEVQNGKIVNQSSGPFTQKPIHRRIHVQRLPIWNANGTGNWTFIFYKCCYLLYMGKGCRRYHFLCGIHTFKVVFGRLPFEKLCGLLSVFLCNTSRDIGIEFSTTRCCYFMVDSWHLNHHHFS